MEILWGSFAWSLGIGVPLFGLACYLWRVRLGSSWLRRFLASLLLGAASAPTVFSPHGPPAVFAAVFLSPFCIFDPVAGLMFVVLPILTTTAIVFVLWSTGLWIYRRHETRVT
jgi:hypothetical protein